MFKKFSSFMIFSYSLIAYYDSSKYVCESEMFAKISSDMLDVKRFTDEVGYNCARWSVYEVDKTISKYISDIFIMAEKVTNLRRHLVKEENVFFNKNKDGIVKSISEEYMCANKAITCMRSIIQACKDFCIEIEKECSFKIYGHDISNYGGNTTLNIRNDNVMIFNNLYKSCFKAYNEDFFVKDEIKQLRNISFLVKEKLLRYMLWGADVYCDIKYGRYGINKEFSILRERLEKFKNVYSDIESFNRVLDMYEEFFTVIKTEMKKNDLIICGSMSSRSENSEEEKKQHIEFDINCDINDGDSESMNDSYYLGNVTSPSPTEDIKNLIKKRSKGKNKDDLFTRKPRNKKHYGYYEKNPDCDIYTEVIQGSRNDQSVERKNSYRNIQSYLYDPEDMFHDSDDLLYAIFR